MGVESVTAVRRAARSLSVEAWQASRKESPAELTRRYFQGETRDILTELVRLEKASQPGLLGRALVRTLTGAGVAVAFGAIGLCAEAVGGIVTAFAGGGSGHGMVAGMFAAIGGALGASIPVEMPLRIDAASKAALEKAGAALTLLILSSDLPEEVKRSFKGVGSFVVGAPAELTLVFDGESYKSTFESTIRTAIEPHLKELGLEDLMPRFVRFRVAKAWVVEPGQPVTTNGTHFPP